MRYIHLTHKPEQHDVIDERGNVVGQALMTLESLLNSNCWGQPEWRQDEAWLAAWERLTDSFERGFRTMAPYVAADDKDYEKFAPIATLKGKQIAPHLARAVTKITAPITRASSTEPEAAKQMNGAEKALPEAAQAS
jgi:hypothetical protein